MKQENDYLGPLPEAGANAALERRSLGLLGARLPAERFIVRDERAADYGVDFTLEVLVSSRATNCRAHAQLKARSGLEANVDGSLSLVVDVTNLNYLLNGSCPIYVLYRPEGDEFLFTFADDERRRLAAQDSRWMEAKTVTLRLRQRLDDEGMRRLAERIVEEAQRHRAVRDAMAAVMPNTRQRVEIGTTPGGREVIGPDEATSVLASDGLALVAHGLASRVLELVAILPQRIVERSALLLLVRGYAQLTNHQYLAASGSLRSAKVVATHLEPAAVHVLEFLLIGTDYALGETSLDEFQALCAHWRTGAPEYLAVQYDLQRIWSRRMHADATEVEAFQGDLADVLRRMAALADVPPALRQQAGLLQLFLDGQERTMALVRALAYARDPSLWSRVYEQPPAQVFAEVHRALDEWRANLDRLVREIKDSGNAPLYCQAIHGRDICDSFVLSQAQFASLHDGQRLSPQAFDALLVRVRETQAVARQLDQPDIELRSRLVEGDLAALAGDENLSRIIAAEVRDIARTLRYADVERVAEKAMTSTLHEDTFADIARLREQGPGFAFARMTDEDLDALARDTCESLRVPMERLPVVRDGLERQRAVALLQQTWCRHLGVLERQADGDAEELFVESPETIAVCELLQQRSAIPSEAWAAVIDTFRRVSCHECPHRSPWAVPAAKPNHGDGE